MSRYTREIHTQDRAGTQRASLARRHKLLRTSQAILYRGDTAHRQQHRTVWCHRHVVSEGGMTVHRKLDGSRARLGKVKTCGSVWACPVCGAKITEQRRRELSFAVTKHVQAGGHVYLVTFTFPHYIGQGLDELMEPFTKARQSFQNGRKWKAVMEAANKIGVVNSLEVTYGSANGWHPHLHMLVFCDPAAFGEGDPDEAGRLSSHAIDHLRGEWVRMLEKRGLVSGSNRQWALSFGLDVRGGRHAAEYIAKWGHDEAWGLASELTSAHAKTGKRDTWGTREHFTPFQLLAMATAGDGHAICAFREFVGAFDGKRMLTWSKGLKAHFGIDDMDDETAAAEPELALEDEQLVGELHQEQLQVLVKYGRLGDFLSFVAEFGHMDEPQRLIDEWVQAIERAGGKHGKGNIVVDRLKISDHSYFMVPEEIEG